MSDSLNIIFPCSYIEFIWLQKNARRWTIKWRQRRQRKWRMSKTETILSQPLALMVRCNTSSPQLEITIGCSGWLRLSTGRFSMATTTSCPLTTRPNTTCFLWSWWPWGSSEACHVHLIIHCCTLYCIPLQLQYKLYCFTFIFSCSYIEFMWMDRGSLYLKVWNKLLHMSDNLNSVFSCFLMNLYECSKVVYIYIYIHGVCSNIYIYVQHHSMNCSSRALPI